MIVSLAINSTTESPKKSVFMSSSSLNFNFHINVTINMNP